MSTMRVEEVTALKETPNSSSCECMRTSGFSPAAGHLHAWATLHGQADGGGDDPWAGLFKGALTPLRGRCAKKTLALEVQFYLWVMMHLALARDKFDDVPSWVGDWLDGFEIVSPYTEESPPTMRDYLDLYPLKMATKSKKSVVGQWLPSVKDSFLPRVQVANVRDVLKLCPLIPRPFAVSAFGPTSKGDLDLTLQPDRIHFLLVMEDLTSQFTAAHVLDLKLGCRLDAPDYCKSKNDNRMERAEQPMFKQHGFQISGLSCVGSESPLAAAWPRSVVRGVQDMEGARSLLTQVLRFQRVDNDTLCGLISHIERMVQWFETSGCGLMFRGSSLLLILSENKAQAKLIDFCHVYFYFYDLLTPQQKRDEGVIRGLRNVSLIVEAVTRK